MSSSPIFSCLLTAPGSWSVCDNGKSNARVAEGRQKCCGSFSNNEVPVARFPYEQCVHVRVRAHTGTHVLLTNPLGDSDST